jgi:GDP-mannose 4,6 dehydratase
MNSNLPRYVPQYSRPCRCIYLREQVTRYFRETDFVAFVRISSALLVITVMARNQTILVTGITGFIGSHVALKLLQAGFSVRGAVRSTNKGELLVQQAIFDEYRSRFTIIEVPNIEEPGAFDEAVKGYPVFFSLYWYRQNVK